MKRIIPILGLVCTVFFSCTMNEMVFDDLNDSGQEKLITRTSVTNDDEDFAPVEHNPYSLSVMQSVYDNYSLEQVELEPTDLYVRFMPQDSTQFHFLLYESGLELFDYPLDVDLTDAEIDSLETAETEYSFNWLYTTVKPDYDFPAEMTYEILDECYIPEENESIVQTRGGLSVDVEAAAYQSLGYDDFEDVDGDVLTRAGRVTPEGTIKVYVSQNNYAPLKGVKIRGHRFVKLKKFMYYISKSVPVKINFSDMARDLELSRDELPKYLEYLEKAELVSVLRMKANGDAILRKMGKLYLQNSNMSYVLSGENPDTGNARETIFYCWTKQKYDTVESPVSDFEIDGKTFEVGGRNKGKKRISNLEDAYVVKDTIEYVFDNQVPLWMFGFLY